MSCAFFPDRAVNEDLVPLWLDPFCHFAFRCYFYFLSVCIYVLIIISAFFILLLLLSYNLGKWRYYYKVKKILYTCLTTLRLSVWNSSVQLTCSREWYCSASVSTFCMFVEDISVFANQLLICNSGLIHLGLQIGKVFSNSTKSIF